uniref:Uncharacterized protein n=1 Tax=viral metagenome TaxID=1070528 RepID=A0A6H1ZGU6_9ZZZZ
MTFEVGEGLTSEQKIKAEEVVRKPATPLKPVEYTPESKYRALGVATLLRSKGKEVPEVVAEAEKIMMRESAMMAMGGATPLKVAGKVATKLIPKISPVQKIIDALTKAKPLRAEQEVLYTKARSVKLAKMLGVAEKTSGEKGFFAEKGALRGKLPKVQFESIRNQIGQKDIDTLFNQVKESPVLSEWEKLPAREGLSKLFGETGGQVPTKNEISLLKTVFGEDFTKAVLDKRTLLQKMTEAGIQLANIPRSIMASFDLSAPLRQGIFLAARHPKMFFSSFAKQFKTFASEKAYKGLMDDIVNRPTYKVMRENKLAITELGQAMTTREEAFMSNWAEKIPVVGRVVRASGRAYTGFLNKLRADVFDDFIKQGTKLGIDDPKFLKSAADFVNHATGRGTLGGLEKAAVPLNTFFFSPRLIMSRLNLINPIYYAKLHPQVRKEAIKSLFGFAGMSLTVGGLLKMGGASVELDPRNADFMKPKFGNTRYDILGGFQQPIRLAAQLISGKIISSTTGKTVTLGEGYKPLTRVGIIGRYFSYKEAPLISFAHALLKGQTAIGEKVDIPTEIVNRFIPMVAQDMIDIYREEGVEGIPMAIPAIFGVGVQSYGGVESYNLQGKKYPELNEELDRLKTTIGFPSTQAFGTELSNKEYKKLREISGTMISDILTGVIKDPSYTELTDYQKKQLINKVVDKVKTKAKGKLFPEKDIKNEIKKRLIKRGIDEEEAKRMADEIYSKEY